MLKRMLMLIVLLSTIWSALFFVLVYAAAFKCLSPNFQNRPRQWSTHYAIGGVIFAVQSSFEERKQLPPNLTDPAFTKHFRGRQEAFDPQQGPLDAWGHPMIYKVDGKDFQVLSYGRDGQPGGEGLDADFGGPNAEPTYLLTNMPNVGPIEPPTFEQFLSTRDKEEISGNSPVMWGAFCVVFTFGIAIANTWGLWRIALSRLFRRFAGRVITLRPLSETELREEQQVVDQYANDFAVIDPHASRAMRVRSLFHVFGIAMIQVVASVVVSYFLMFAHIRSGH